MPGHSLRSCLLRSFWLVLGALGCTRATAQLTVNIDVWIGSGAVYSGQGAYAEPGKDYWNVVATTAGGTGFLASDGTTATGLSFAVDGIDSEQIGYGGRPDFAGDLLADYFYLYGTTPATFTIGGLTVGHSYDFYFYSQAGSSHVTDRAAVFTFGGGAQNLTANFADSFVSGTNYVQFSLVADSATLTGSFVGTLDGNEAEFNGLQIVDQSVSAVPEPSACAAIAGALGLGGTLGVRLRRRGDSPGA